MTALLITTLVSAAVMVCAIVIAVSGFYLLVAYVVHKTGKTTGIADIGRAAAAILAALLRVRL